MSYFQDAWVTCQGQEYRLSAEEGRALETRSLNYWHGPGDPSSWLGVAVFQLAQQKVEAPQRVALELAAAALGITLERMRALIRWHEQYMRWHDGDLTYRVLEE